MYAEESAMRSRNLRHDTNQVREPKSIIVTQSTFSTFDSHGTLEKLEMRHRDAIMREQDQREMDIHAVKEQNRMLSVQMLELLDTHAKDVDKMRKLFAANDDRVRYNTRSYTRSKESKYKQGQIVMQQEDQPHEIEVDIDGSNVQQFYTEAKSME